MDWKNIVKKTLLILGGIIGVMGVYLLIFKTLQNWDSDPDRGAIVINNSKFKDAYDKVYPNAKSGKEILRWQGWAPEDSMWFYTTTQGSDLLPYDFFMVLEQANSTALFRSNENMDEYRYIVLKPTFSNPDGLPLGFDKDDYKGKEYLGFTCAACHTGQINYKGTAMRVDGAPALADMETFIDDLNKSLNQTLKDEAKRQRFIKAVLDRNGFGKWITGGRNYTSEKDVEADLKTFASRLEVYATINKSKYDSSGKPGARYGDKDLKYGYGRLDAFGRIFNRTLQHILSKKDVENVLSKVVAKDKLQKILDTINTQVLSDKEFDHILDRIRPLLSDSEIIALRDQLFNSANAPVSYPYMWDVPQHDYLQWNGIAANAGVGPLARNTGEVIGVFGTLDWQEKKTITISSLLMGDSDKKLLFASSVNGHNLERLEHSLNNLYSPRWPEEILGKIDKAGADRGKKLFEDYCINCHGDIDRTDPRRKVIARFSNFKEAGTDLTMGTNALTRTGKSGILDGTYQGTGVGNLLITETAPVALVFMAVVKNVIATPDPDKGVIHRIWDLVYNLASTFINNKIQPSLRQGSYTPSTTNGPFNELAAYKARPLNGIWATAPYLHNGSVPTLYDLLLPSKKDGVSKDGKYRPERFLTGSREFDPERVGFISKDYDGFVFDTNLPGNHNTGHNYGNNEFTDQERRDLVEYLKTL